MSTTLAAASLALSSAALASSTPTCGNSGPLPIEAMYALKACVAMLIIAPIVGAIVDTMWDRVASAVHAFGMALVFEIVAWMVFFAVGFLISPVGA